MLRRNRKKRFAVITLVYWFLLCYLIAALTWWFIELWQQNRDMYVFKKDLIRRDDPLYTVMLRTITEERDRNNAQYLGEGLMFLVLTIIGAIFVYRAARRQIRLNTQQQNFMMAVTHELKTPIAVTKLNLETLSRHKLDEEKQKKIISNTLHETNRLNDLCDNILLSSQLDAGGFKLNKETVDLGLLLTDAVRNFRQRYPNRSILCSTTQGILFDGDSFLLGLALNNLLENALKYSPADTSIEVALEQRQTEWLICVKDRGPGIPEIEKKKVFERFYRLGSEQTRQTKGTGLGLYLTRKIMKDHGGDVMVTDNQPSGAVFILKLPKSLK